MDESVKAMETLLREIVEQMVAATRTDTNAAATKLHRVAAIASTLAHTVRGARR